MRFARSSSLLLVSLTSVGCVGCADEPPPLEVTTGAASSGAGGSDGGTSSARVISTSTASDYERSPQIAALQGKLIGVVWTGGKDDGSPSHIGYTFSTDGGDSWQEPGIIESPDDDEYLDPDLAVDIQGNFYLVWVAYSRVGKGGKILGATATESQLEFKSVTSVTDDMVTGYYERPRVAVTKTGIVIATYSELGPPESLHGLTVALRAGAGWTRTPLGTSDTHTLLPYPCAPPEGGVGVGRTWVVFQRNHRAQLIFTDDDGSTWSSVASVNAPDDDGIVHQVHSCVADADNVWVAYGAGDVSGLSQRLRIAHSSDGGMTFNEHIDAHDPVSSRYANPALSLQAQEPRALDLVYYAGSGQGDTAASVRHARLPLPPEGADAGTPPPMDGGVDAGVGTKSSLVYKPIVLDSSPTSPQWLGEYAGVASSSGKVFVAFVDNNGPSDRSHVAFHRLDDP